MSTDPVQIVAEMRAAELMSALQAAVGGEAHWRLRASVLLREIDELVLPPEATARLVELDSLKRSAEILEDASCDGKSA